MSIECCRNTAEGKGLASLFGGTCEAGSCTVSGWLSSAPGSCRGLRFCSAWQPAAPRDQQLPPPPTAMHPPLQVLQRSSSACCRAGSFSRAGSCSTQLLHPELCSWCVQLTAAPHGQSLPQHPPWAVPQLSASIKTPPYEQLSLAPSRADFQQTPREQISSKFHRHSNTMTFLLPVSQGSNPFNKICISAPSHALGAPSQPHRQWLLLTFAVSVIFRVLFTSYWTMHNYFNPLLWLIILHTKLSLCKLYRFSLLIESRLIQCVSKLFKKSEKEQNKQKKNTDIIKDKSRN